MDTKFKRTLLAALIAAMLVPIGAQAAEADLLKKIEILAQEIEALKSQVKADREQAAKAQAAQKA